jgi:Uncharacterized conserved protein
MTVYDSEHQHVPEELKEFDHWVLWGLDGDGQKRPLAPWMRGDLYPAKWGHDAPTRPETDWETAYRCWKHRHSYAHPQGLSLDSVLPAPLLLHDPLDPPLMQVDFDDVRNPETGEVTDEVVALVDRLEAFCEISQSGTGLHVFVRASLPGGLGKFIASLGDTGDIELYDHGRCVGATWDHVPGTPIDVPERQSVIDSIISEYESSDQRERRIGPSRDDNQHTNADTDINISGSSETGGDDNPDTSPYFDVDVRTIADTGWFARYRDDAPGDGSDGPHPGHGPQHSDPEECTNFGIAPKKNGWFCFAHESGGRGIELAAVLCPATDVNCDNVPRKNPGGWLRDQPIALLRTCLWLRSEGVVDSDAMPPYDALLAVADVADLYITDPHAGILGDANKDIARQVYDEMTLEDI